MCRDLVARLYALPLIETIRRCNAKFLLLSYFHIAGQDGLFALLFGVQFKRKSDRKHNQVTSSFWNFRVVDHRWVDDYKRYEGHTKPLSKIFCHNTRPNKKNNIKIKIIYFRFLHISFEIKIK